MPVCLDSNYSRYTTSVRTNWLHDGLHNAFQERSSNCITVGIINNMRDGALQATERQFISLLESASAGIQIRLSFYALPRVPRNEAGARHITNSYLNVDNLWGKHLDGLIVTGREPLTPNLRDEPYWNSFVEILDWAIINTYSTIWSCLAAHAAVLHMDGIGRLRSKNKYCGVFECNRLSDHALTTDAPSSFRLPHSRWNGVPEDALTSCGYSVLTKSADAGVDTFVKQYKSLFVFFQGHPEYDADTLLLEYRRDIGRYLRGEAASYPLMPRDYFDHQTAIALTAIQNKAMSNPGENLLPEISAALENTKIKSSWHSTSTCIYRNWLEYICAQKELQLNGASLPCQHSHNPASPHQRPSF